MSETITEKWRCCECGDVHDFEDDAYTCCPPQVSKVYVCQDCGDTHHEKSEAAACCSDAPEERRHEVLRPSTAQLEALGQLRLVP